MPQAFSGAADFSGITPAEPLHISSVQHKATMRFDNKGTEASAGTGVVAAVGGARPSFQVMFDRPYLLLVRDRVSGTPLFLARVVDPSQHS